MTIVEFCFNPSYSMFILMKDGQLEEGNRVRLCNDPHGDVELLRRNTTHGQIGTVLRKPLPNETVFVQWSAIFGCYVLVVNLVFVADSE